MAQLKESSRWACLHSFLPGRRLSIRKTDQITAKKEYRQGYFDFYSQLEEKVIQPTRHHQPEKKNEATCQQTYFYLDLKYSPLLEKVMEKYVKENQERIKSLYQDCQNKNEPIDWVEATIRVYDQDVGSNNYNAIMGIRNTLHLVLSGGEDENQLKRIMGDISKNIFIPSYRHFMSLPIFYMEDRPELNSRFEQIINRAA